MKYAKLPINTYLNRLAAKTSAPGGGSAAALFGAMGCALMEMVVNYSDKKKPRIKGTASVFKHHRRNFIGLMDKDAQAYARLCVVKKYQSRASTGVQAALKRCALVPLKMCEISSKAVRSCKGLRVAVNKNLMSDLHCAVSSFKCAFECARFNIDVNLKYTEDKKFINSTRKKLKRWQRF